MMMKVEGDTTQALRQWGKGVRTGTKIDFGRFKGNGCDCEREKDKGRESADRMVGVEWRQRLCVVS